MPNTPELKPCPFCGDPMRFGELYFTHTELSDCFISALALRNEAITAWNTRQVTQLEAQLAEMSEASGDLCDAVERFNGRVPATDESLARVRALLTQSKEPK